MPVPSNWRRRQLLLAICIRYTVRDQLKELTQKPMDQEPMDHVTTIGARDSIKAGWFDCLYKYAMLFGSLHAMNALFYPHLFWAIQLFYFLKYEPWCFFSWYQSRIILILSLETFSSWVFPTQNGRIKRFKCLKFSLFRITYFLSVTPNFSQVGWWKLSDLAAASWSSCLGIWSWSIPHGRSSPTSSDGHWTSWRHSDSKSSICCLAETR